jgi:hypothetical protein
MLLVSPLDNLPNHSIVVILSGDAMANNEVSEDDKPGWRIELFGGKLSSPRWV